MSCSADRRRDSCLLASRTPLEFLGVYQDHALVTTSVSHRGQRSFGGQEQASRSPKAVNFIGIIHGPIYSFRITEHDRENETGVVIVKTDQNAKISQNPLARVGPNFNACIMVLLCAHGGVQFHEFFPRSMGQNVPKWGAVLVSNGRIEQNLPLAPFYALATRPENDPDAKKKEKGEKPKYRVVDPS